MIGDDYSFKNVSQNIKTSVNLSANIWRRCGNCSKYPIRSFNATVKNVKISNLFFHICQSGLLYFSFSILNMILSVISDSVTGSSVLCFSVLMSCEMMSMGTGNTMVLLFSAEMLFNVCRYLQHFYINLRSQPQEDGDQRSPELESGRTVHNDLSSLPQGPAGLVFSLSSDHFGSGLSGRLSLSSHGSLERLRHSNVFHLHPLHGDAPRFGRNFQTGLKRRGFLRET